MPTTHVIAAAFPCFECRLEQVGGGGCNGSQLCCYWPLQFVEELLLCGGILHHHQVVLACLFELWCDHNFVLLRPYPQEFQIILRVQLLND